MTNIDLQEGFEHLGFQTPKLADLPSEAGEAEQLEVLDAVVAAADDFAATVRRFLR